MRESHPFVFENTITWVMPWIKILTIIFVIKLENANVYLLKLSLLSLLKEFYYLCASVFL